MALNYIEDMALNNFLGHENLAGQNTIERGEALGYICLKDFGNFFAEGMAFKVSYIRHSTDEVEIM